VVFFAVLALAAGAFGALALPRLAVATPPEQWRLAAAQVEEQAPARKPHRCRHDGRPAPRPFDDAR
jgi:hypothetical protein